jgi:hypothetical protein
VKLLELKWISVKLLELKWISVYSNKLKYYVITMILKWYVSLIIYCHFNNTVNIQYFNLLQYTEMHFNLTVHHRQ